MHYHPLSGFWGSTTWGVWVLLLWAGVAAPRICAQEPPPGYTGLRPFRTDTCQTPGCFYDIGNRHFRKNTASDYHFAMQAYQQGLAMAEARNQLPDIARGVYLVGGVYETNWSLDAAEPYYTRYLALAQQMQIPAKIADAYHALHVLALKRQQEDSSLGYIRKALNIATQQPESIRIENAIKYRIAYCNALALVDSIDEAEAQLRIAQQLFNEPGIPAAEYDLLQFNEFRAKHLLLTRKGQAAAANTLCEEFVRNHPHNSNIGEVWLEIRRYYTRIKNYQKAFEAIEIIDSILRITNDRTHNQMLEELFIQYETDRIEAENTQQRTLLAQQQTTNTFLIIGIIILVTAVVVILIFQIRLRRASRNTIAANAQLRRSENEKELLFRELHHRVKNNLQMLGSLLYLQAREKRNTGAYDELIAAHKRVEALAMVHRDLYKTEDVSQVEMQRYLADLAQSIADAHSARPVELQADFAPLALHPDKAIALGLIINELITNSFKYVPAELPKINIHIRLWQPSPGQWHLKYTDNGPGPGTDPHTGAFGMRMMTTMAELLNGGYTTNGNEWLFTFNF